MPSVQSSNVESFDYEMTERNLTVRFRSGRTYRYADVPAGVVGALEEALNSADASFGKAFNSLVRSAGYEYEEVTE